MEDTAAMKVKFVVLYTNVVELVGCAAPIRQLSNLISTGAASRRLWLGERLVYSVSAHRILK